MSPNHAPVEPCVLVIFGASGDLTQRKLIPALYDLSRQGRLPAGLRVVGVSRTAMSDDAFRDKMAASVKEFSANFEAEKWPEFAKRLHYYAGDGVKLESFPGLTKRIAEVGEKAGILRLGGMPNILFYLSVAPELYEGIIENVGQSGLIAEGHRWCSINAEQTPWQRIIVEKPFGHDLASAASLNRALGRVFEEEATYRIDHYLGKELVQNILVMRFANTIFEPMWNRNYVDHVQVTAAEKVGVGARAANFYDTAGALRDMIQSHLLQILALVAIEPPSVFDANAIMREKIKLVNCSPTLSAAEAPANAVLGRYTAGAGGGGGGEPAYVGEKGVDPSRRTETYAAMRVYFDNWRWAGVPFYLRSGKRMAAKLTEVVVQFKKPPMSVFRNIDPALADRPVNQLVISIAPREGISLRIEGKVPGAGLRMDSAELGLDYLERFGGEVIEAYGPLILDAIRGDRTLYKHRDEVEGGWRICDPIIHSPQLRERIADYAPGSWGPAAADALIAEGAPAGIKRAWHNV